MSPFSTGSRWGNLFAFLSPWFMALISGAPLAAVEHGSPPSVPPLEAEPGANLYWHEPGAFWDEGCDCTVQTDFFGYAPRWYAAAELQALWRDNLRASDFASLGEGGPTVLSTGSLDDEFKGGCRLLLGWTISDWYRLEGSYFGAFRWSDSAAVRNSDINSEGEIGNLFSPFSNFGESPILGLDFNDFARVSLSSNLDNVELNLRRRIGLPPAPFEASFLVGIRYMQIQERFRYHTEANVPLPLGAVNNVLTSADNDLVGVQIGFLAQWLVHPRSWIDCEVKGAAFSNAADLHTHFENTDEDGIVTGYAGHDGKTVSVGLLDLSLMLNHQFTRALTFRIGYSAMFMTGLALGADNFSRDVDLLTQGPVLLNDNGRVIYHGPAIGLVGAW
jgi:hypothetical protein